MQYNRLINVNEFHQGGSWWDSDMYDDTGDVSDTGSSSDTDSNSDTPTPSHECTECANSVYIESAYRKRVKHFCEQCDELTYHVRLQR